MSVPPEIYKAVHTAVWADGTLGRAINAQFIKIKLKGRAKNPTLKTVPIEEGGIGWHTAHPTEIPQT